MYEDIGFTGVTRLSDFTYSWLGRFCVDASYRRVRSVDFDERDKVDEMRL